MGSLKLLDEILSAPVVVSSIVIFASVAIAATATAFKNDFGIFQNVGGVIGTLVSALFLLAIATINIVILATVYRTFRQVKAGAPYVDEDLDMLLAGRGLLARLFRPMFSMVRRSWHMYPLGFLFGLGFDTATEVGYFIEQTPIILRDIDDFGCCDHRVGKFLRLTIAIRQFAGSYVLPTLAP